MSPTIFNPYRFATASTGAWETSGYGTSAPVITTVTNSNDTGAPSGSGATSVWANGTAITLTTANEISVKITGTTGESGTVSNTIIGLSTLDSAAATDSVNMTTWTSGTSSGTVVYARINEPANYLTYYEGGGYDESSTFTSTSIYKITVDGTSATFFKDDVSIRTATVTAGTYYGFISAYLGGYTTGTFQLV